jgi:hypothetical protein
MARILPANVYKTESFSYAYRYLQNILMATGLTETAAAIAAEGMITEAESYGWDGCKAVKIEYDNVTYTITNKQINP